MADPVDLGAQSDLIGAPEPMSIEAVLADQNGYARATPQAGPVTERATRGHAFFRAHSSSRRRQAELAGEREWG